jgi:hypothetical protein
VVSGVTLPASAYPTTISDGPLTSATCGTANPTACPGLYVTDNQGNLWYYSGQSTANGASPLSGTVYLVGNIDKPTADWALNGPSGSQTASDLTGNGNTATMEGSSNWASDPTRGTVLSLNGTSGYLQLPTDLFESTSTLSFSMWFKTSTAGGVLLSTGNSDPGVTNSGTIHSRPILYVGTDGLLYGQFWTGQAGDMVSAKAVDDGQWHHVVITGNGATQSLYLDGQLVGAVGGTIQNLDPLEFLGAGYINADGWVNAPPQGWNYFNGEISDAEFYSYALNPDEVTALYGGQQAIKGLG